MSATEGRLADNNGTLADNKGTLADNIVHFGRVLRHAGLPVGSDRITTAIEAVQAVGIDNKTEVRSALIATLLSSRDQLPIFNQAFHAFWRDPKLLERLMYLVLPKISGRGERYPDKDRLRRLDEALRPQEPAQQPQAPQKPQAEQKIEFEALLTMSERERLQQADFETMSNEEFALAKRMAAQAALPLKPRRLRRWETSHPRAQARYAMRASLRHALANPDTLVPRFEARQEKIPPVVCLLDISGSMERYSRMFLHFAHAMMQEHQKRGAAMHVFVFGTRLTNITRVMRGRDPDEALYKADKAVQDWKGGTRIASSFRRFNKDWGRRVLGGGASLLLITDGLDRDEGGELGKEAQRLGKSARQVLWLNPLLRYDQFEPRAAGVKAILPHVTAFLPVHNVASLKDLAQAMATNRGKAWK